MPRVGAALGLKVLVRCAAKAFEDRYNPKELLSRSGLTVEMITADIA